MGGLRQERVGGGRTNLAGGGGPPADRPHTSSGSLPSSAGSRPSTAGARHRPPPAPLDEASSSQLVVWPNDRGSRPTSAPARRPSTEPAGSAGPPRPWQNAEETGGRGQPISASASGFEGVTRNRVKRDELFGNGSDKGGSSRPSTASSRDSRASREGLPPRARPGSAPNQRQNEDERLATTSSMNSETSSACEERLLSFQKYFQDKNFAKFSHLKVSARPCRSLNPELQPAAALHVVAALP